MKAIHVTQYGGPEVLEVVDVPEPVPGSRQVLVKMKVTGYNFHFGSNSHAVYSQIHHSSCHLFLVLKELVLWKQLALK